MESHQHLEFIRAQGTKLLTSLPAPVRSRLRHYEVAAVMPFQPRHPLQSPALSRRFVYAIVTDWSLLLVAMSAKEEATVMLELPLLLIDDMVMDALDVDDFANDSRRSVRSTCISIYPQQPAYSLQQAYLRRQQQQQQQQTAQTPIQQGPLHSWQLQQLHQQHCQKQPQQVERQAYQQHQQEFHSQQQQGQDSPQDQHLHCLCAPWLSLELIKNMLPGSNSSSITPRLRINRSALEQQEQQDSQKEASNTPSQPRRTAAQPSSRCQSPLNEQKQHAQQQLTRQLMQRLQTPMPAAQHQQKQQQYQHTRGPQPIGEATEGQVEGQLEGLAGDAVALDAASGGIARVPPWLVKHQQPTVVAADAAGVGMTAAVVAIPAEGTSKMVVARSSSRLAKLKGRLTIDAAAAAPQLLSHTTIAAAAAAAVAPAAAAEQQSNTPRDQQLQVDDCVLHDASYCLQLITVERFSCLFFHVHQSWIGAHVRAALAAAAAPGLPAWLPPPSALFQVQQHQVGLPQPDDHQQQQQQQRQQQKQSATDCPSKPMGAPLTSSIANGFRGLASPLRGGTPVVVGAAASVTAATAQASTSSASSGASSLSSAAQAALQSDMKRFFGMDRNPATAKLLAGPFPGDERNFPQQPADQQLSLVAASCNSPAVASASAGSSMWENDPSLDARITDAQKLREAGRRPDRPAGMLPVSAFTPHLSTSISPAFAADCTKLMAKYHATRRASCPAVSTAGYNLCQREVELLQREQQQRQGQQQPESPGKGAAKGSSKRQQKMLRTCMQVGAGVYAQHTASEARDLFWSLADGLVKPCSLFDEGDATRIKQLVLELAFCKQQQVAALQQAFFASSDVISFLLARLTAWGGLMNLFPEGLPPIQNPAQPGRLEAWRGKSVAWTSSLMYPGRPRNILKRLGLAASSKVCFRSVLNAALSIAERHRHAEQRAARAASGGQHVREVPLNQTYNADPLNLSPLASLSHVYMFVGDARKMVTGRMSSNGGSESPCRLALHSSGKDASFSDEESEHSAGASSTMAEATNILRWERLAGLLAARLAACKMQLVLFWMQLQLAYTEGVGSRQNWLADKALGPGPSQANLSSHWTFRQATQQLVATLINLNLPGTQQLTALIPGGIDDLLWWAQSGANSWMLDYVVGVLHELMGMAQQEQQLTASTGAGLVVEVLQQAPSQQLRSLLRCMFVRFICLMGGSAGNREYTVLPAGVAAVLGYRYGCVLMEVFGGILGAADGLCDEFGVEVSHMLQVPEVQAQLCAAAAGADSGVLGRSSLLLLEDVLTAVGAAVVWTRMPADTQGLTVAALGRMCCVMTMQN